MTSGPVSLTIGWVGRHTPPGAGVDGRDAAVIDIAQDLLLRELHSRGVLDALAFKGGTSLRKLYAGNQGRFSLDLDFSVASPADDPDTVLLRLISEIDGLTVGPFAYGVTERRGKWSHPTTGRPENLGRRQWRRSPERSLETRSRTTSFRPKPLAAYPAGSRGRPC